MTVDVKNRIPYDLVITGGSNQPILFDKRVFNVRAGDKTC